VPLPPGSVAVRDLWESFTIYHDRPVSLKDRLIGKRKTAPEEFWALQGVSLEVEPGETLALVGANGSGKSTLLKVMARILEPDRGTVEIGGRLAALLEVGAGFHGDLTGRENVYLNASILGFGRKEVDRIFDDIVGFAELERFIDTPVRTYSSGMYVRLGFAVAVHLNPHILLVDEVLAVGDARFQARCFDRIRSLQRDGRTIIFVTHDTDLAASLCKRAILLVKGEVEEAGPSHKVVDRYRELYTAEGTHQLGQFGGGEVHGTGEIRLSGIRLVTEAGDPVVRVGEQVSVTFAAEATTDVTHPVFGLIVRAPDGTYLYDTNTLWRSQDTGAFQSGDKVVVRYDFKANLLPGMYLVTVAAANEDGRVAYDWHTDVLPFEVRGNTHARGIAALEADITIEAL
jgi:ABC-type polysaccharide/polyol phosphate transport system ATPase subunit